MYGGSGLVILDVDEPDSEDLASAQTHLPETSTVESPHGGEHRYYAVESHEELLDRVNKQFGSDNPAPSYGDTRTVRLLSRSWISA